MTSEYRFYRFLYTVLRIILTPIYPIKVIGRENITDDAAIICANHSSWVDPVLMAFAFTKKVHLHLMAKIELFNVPVVSTALRKIGTFPVDRGHADLNSIRTAMRYLKSGEKVGIFPEGTRTAEDGDVSPKAGAVRIAERADVSLVPVYISRHKRIFRRSMIVIGKPFKVSGAAKRMTKEESEKAAEELMDKISELGNMING